MAAEDGDDNRKRRRVDDRHRPNDRESPVRHRESRDFDRRPARRPFEEAPHAKLRRMLLHIAGTVETPQDEAATIVEILNANLDDERLKEGFFEDLEQLIVEQPFRIPFVALIAFYGNHANPEIATESIKRVAARTQTALNQGNWTEFKLMLRFLACLQLLFEGDGVFTFLEQLFDTAADLQSANENDVVGIELVKIILLTIPYALAYGGGRFHEEAQALLGKTGIVADNMLPMEDLLHTYAVDSNAEDQTMAYQGVIRLLQNQLENEAASGWAFSCIPRFPPRAIRKSDEEPPAETEAQTFPFPSFTIPSPVNPGPRPLFPESHFSLYTGQEIETVPKTTDIAASLIRDGIVDTINQLDFNRELVAKFVIDLDNFWSYDKFAKRGIPFDTFRDTVGDKIVWKSEDVIVEAIFSQLFKLPNPEHKLVFYHSIITACCKIAPAAIAPSLGRAIRTIYKNLDVMDLELAYRFLDWFSHHLSNFEFRWRWAEWLDDLALSDLHPRKAFIISALDREIRLSFSKRIRSTVPEPMHALIPTRLDQDNSPDFKYEDPATPYAEQGQKLLQLLRHKGGNEEMDKVIDEIQTKAAENGVTDTRVPSADAFMTGICRAGAKSLSHVLSCIERGKEQLLKMANESEAARRQITKSVVEYWKDQPGVAVRIIDILLNYTILTPMAVVQWVLGDNMGAGEALSKAWVFEIVSNTVTKVTKRNRQIALARLQKNLGEEQMTLVANTLATDRDNARELFRYIEDSVNAVGRGNAILLVKMNSGEISEDDGKLIRAWAPRWSTVFRRKAQVEESVIGEEAVEARVKLLAAEIEADAAAAAAQPMEEDHDVREEVGNGVDEEML